MIVTTNQRAGRLADRPTRGPSTVQRGPGAHERPRTNVGGTERLASTMLGGTLLMLGSGRSGISRGLLSMLGGGLLYRGVSGHCPVYQQLGLNSANERRPHARLADGPELDAPEVQRSITIGRPAAELFARWLEPETQALIMAHFAEVSGDPRGRLHWRVRGPLGKVLHFDTSCVESRSGELIRWRSQSDATLPCEWSLLLRNAPANFGTELTLQVRFDPPGLIGGALSKLLGSAPRLIVERTLRNFKSLVESGEIPTAFHNPSARAGARSDRQPAHALRAAAI